MLKWNYDSTHIHLTVIGVLIVLLFCFTGDTTLELTLPKSSEGVRWKKLLEEDNVSGEEVFDPQLIEEVNQRLAHLTSDKLVS